MRTNPTQVNNKKSHSKPKQKSFTPHQSQSQSHTKAQARAERETVSAGLAVCLIGFSRQKMYDSEYEEEVRKHAVMQEVLPDAVMWKKWEATEAPLRQGRGWYPTLDRHFLELLVVSEIHCLSHPLSVYSNATAEKIHRHATRVRRVACERIGSERLHAYCDRVKEAFEAYMQGGWGQTPSQASQVEVEAEADISGEEGEEEGSIEEDRGRGMGRDGSAAQRRDGPPSPPKEPSITILKREDERDVSMVIDVSPLNSPTDGDSDFDSSEDESDSDASLKTASTGTSYGFLDDEREMIKIDLEGVVEVEEDEAESDTRKAMLHDATDVKVGLESGKAIQADGGMDVDVILGSKVPQIHIITPKEG